jgi:hypothetical protein
MSPRDHAQVFLILNINYIYIYIYIKIKIYNRVEPGQYYGPRLQSQSPNISIEFLARDKDVKANWITLHVKVATWQS